MSRIIYLNGKYVPEQEAKVSVFDHGFLYGDGVFEGIRAYKGKVFKLEEHMARLYESAKSIMLDIPESYEEMTEATLETIRQNNLEDAYIRIVVSRGTGDLGLDPRKCPKATTVIIASSITLFPEELYEQGLEVITVATRRNVPDALDPQIKSLNYLNNILVKIEANRAGVMEAIMLNGQGYVAEGTGDNVFIVKRGKILTPPSYVGALCGITRQVIIDLAAEAGYLLEERPFTRHELYVADECFLTGTAAEVIPVIGVDGRQIGSGTPGPVTRDLVARFRELAGTTGTDIHP
ncbi:branched-chain-amino-acid transaminase [Dethiobacter alkaliphilus]|uniref:Branched-chain-amino-acid aminotransferase n=1 Tax=Dethiobacter alkaliphilus AHT 1 TaxID=555088 RepID=C0GI63_DETAL|nr:branched-chain-amino-acid transaminase [Dethiobacter alkaliphilus]EEG76911.1 branched-chain amino acid aminotransferase [Dethiobacter alkaliphilus AHT 1]